MDDGLSEIFPRNSEYAFSKPMNGADIRKLVSVVNKREENIQSFSRKLQAIAGDMLMEVALQGCDLNKLRKSWPERKWKGAFPEQIKIPYVTARKYMLLADHWDRLKLDQCKSLSQCQALITADRHCDQKAIAQEHRKRWPAFQEALNCASRFVMESPSVGLRVELVTFGSKEPRGRGTKPLPVRSRGVSASWRRARRERRSWKTL